MYATEYCLMKFNPPPYVGSICSQTAKQGDFLRTQASKNRFEIHCVHKGRILVRQQEQERVYCEGNVFLVFPEHNAVLIPETPVFRDFVLCFTLNSAMVPLSEQEAVRWEPSRYTDALLPSQVKDPKICTRLVELIQRYHALQQSNDPIRYIRGRAFFSEIVAELSTDALAQARRNIAKTAGKAGAYCDAARTYISAHLQEKIQVEAIARQIGISYNYLNRQFVQQEGIPLVTFINREKIRLACRLLTEQEYVQEEAAAGVGISDVKYFRRLFRRFTGMTVTEYLKLHRNTAL